MGVKNLRLIFATVHNLSQLDLCRFLILVSTVLCYNQRKYIMEGTTMAHWRFYSQSRVQNLWSAAVRFHGVPCATLAWGVRACDTALTKLGLSKAEPGRLVCVSETTGCCVDAFQVGLRCTTGKRSMLFYKTGRFIVTVYDLVTGGSVRLCAQPELEERIRSMKPEELLLLPEEKLFYFEEAHPLTQRVRDRVRAACTTAPEGIPHRDAGVQDSPDQFGKFDLSTNGVCRTASRRYR